MFLTNFRQRNTLEIENLDISLANCEGKVLKMLQEDKI